MNSLMKKIGLGLALGATALTAAAPAEAQRYRGGYGGYHRGYDRGGTAVVAGIAGLAIGAALASNHDRYRGDYYRDGYYRDPGYHAYYDDGYYRDRGYHRGCYIERRWDRYYDRPINVRICR